MQAKLWCTTKRARKVVISLTLVALIVEAITSLSWHAAQVIVPHFIELVFLKTILPVAVLILNVMVVHQVRRSATNAAANLGVQQHHQSTSSNSVVPTVMLVTTSLMYVLLYGVGGIFTAVGIWNWASNYSVDSWIVVYKITIVTASLASFVFGYNFYVYLITGKRFRSELHRLFSCCHSSSFSFSFSFSSSNAAAAAALVADDADVARPGQTDTTV